MKTGKPLRVIRIGSRARDSEPSPDREIGGQFGVRFESILTAPVTAEGMAEGVFKTVRKGTETMSRSPYNKVKGIGRPLRIMGFPNGASFEVDEGRVVGDFFSTIVPRQLLQ